MDSILCLSLWLMTIFIESSADTDGCRLKKDCKSCINFNVDCAWITTSNVKDHCQTLKNIDTSIAHDHVWYPRSKQHELSSNQVFTPNGLKLMLRRNDPVDIKFRYKHVIDHPVDLYFLLDNSFTMIQHKKDLILTINEVLDNLNKITKNSRIGFGSFVDKPVYPFVDGKHCEHRDNCMEPYGFRNHAKLSTDVYKFKRKLESLEDSVNNDTPEGQLDALLQVMVCDQHINWRNQSTKIIMIASDADFHSYGDGLVAGIYRPHDGKCHMDSKGEEYIGYFEYDYPAHNQITYTSWSKGINVIFAIKSYAFKFYTDLVAGMSNFYLKELKDAENLKKLVIEQYKDITTKVDLQYESANPNVAIDFVRNDCTESSEKNSCEGVKKDETIQFTIKITAKSCSSNENGKIEIFPNSRRDERLVIDYEIQCECECRKDDIPNSRDCNLNGTFTCGVCECNPGFIGEKCNCKDPRVTDVNYEDEKALNEKCRNGNDTHLCTSKTNGECSCGSCFCKNGFMGTFCECHENICKRFASPDFCSGHGQCLGCNGCSCDKGWSSDFCDCDLATDNCGPNGTCSSNGICSCNKCQCKDNYDGQFCETCIQCSESCSKITNMINWDDLTVNCTKNMECKMIIVPSFKNDGVSCDGRTRRDGCYYEFQMVKIDASTYEIHILKDKICPFRFEARRDLSILAGTILAIGLLTALLWRLFIFHQDRVEYQKFKKETREAKWGGGQNPLYRETTTEIKNPAYSPDNLDE